MEIVEIIHNNKKHKMIERNGMKIVYPFDMDNKVIKSLEESRKNQKNNTIITLVFGNKETGENWNEINDVKGQIGYTKGNNFSYPIFINFKEKYDDLNFLSNKEIKKFLNKENFNFIDTLSDGGTLILSNIIGIKVNNKTVYKHPKFYNNSDFNKYKIKDENIQKTTIIEKNGNTENISKKNYKQYGLYVYNKKKKEYQLLIKENSKENIKKRIDFFKEMELNKKTKEISGPSI